MALTGELGHLLFPMLPVEHGNTCNPHAATVEAAHIDAKSVWLRARHVEALDAANRAEVMLCGASVEGVGGELVRALEQAEALFRHYEVKIARLSADRAIALLGFDLLRRQYLVAHRAAVTAAF